MRRDLVVLLVLAATAALLFAPSVGGDFVWDDRSLIEENRLLDDWSRLEVLLSSDFFTRSGVEERIGHWRPLVTLSYMVDRAIWGNDPRGFHAVNVVLHAIASCLVFLLGRSLGIGRTVACAAGVLFTVHPVHVESVAWISGRTDLLCAVPALAAALVDARRARTGGVASSVAVFSLTFVALMAKEMAAVLIGVTVLRALLLPSEREKELGQTSAALRAGAAPAVACVAYLALRLGMLGITPEKPAAADLGHVTLFWTWWSGFLAYVRVLAWPVDLGIVPQVPATTWSDPRVVFGLLAFGLLVGTAWRIRTRSPALAWSIGFFLLALVPLTNFVVPIRAPASVEFPWAERFLYLPSVGFVWAVALAPGSIGERGRYFPRAMATALLVAATLLAARTWTRIPEWHDDRALFGAELKRSPQSGTAWLGMADALAREGRTVAAEDHYLRAIRVAPDNAFARFNYGNLLLGRGAANEAQRAFREAIRLRPDYGKAWMNLGIALVRLGHEDQAIECFRRAAVELPASAEARLNLGNALRLAGRPGEAVAAFDQALELDPSLEAARAARASALSELRSRAF